MVWSCTHTVDIEKCDITVKMDLKLIMYIVQAHVPLNDKMEF